MAEPHGDGHRRAGEGGREVTDDAADKAREARAADLREEDDEQDRAEGGVQAEGTAAGRGAGPAAGGPGPDPTSARTTGAALNKK